jgi:hypothetical protein
MSRPAVQDVTAGSLHDEVASAYRRSFQFGNPLPESHQRTLCAADCAQAARRDAGELLCPPAPLRRRFAEAARDESVVSEAIQREMSPVLTARQPYGRDCRGPAADRYLAPVPACGEALTEAGPCPHAPSELCANSVRTESQSWSRRKYLTGFRTHAEATRESDINGSSRALSWRTFGDL